MFPVVAHPLSILTSQVGIDTDIEFHLQFPWVHFSELLLNTKSSLKLPVKKDNGLERK